MARVLSISNSHALNSCSYQRVGGPGYGYWIQGQGLDILDSKNGKLLHPALRLEFATALVNLSSRQVKLTATFDSVDRNDARDHKTEIKRLVNQIKVSSHEAAANAIKNESKRDLEAMQDHQGASLPELVTRLRELLAEAFAAVEQAQAQATQALQAAQRVQANTAQAAQADPNNVSSQSHDPIPTAPAQTHHYQSRSMQPAVQVTQGGATTTQSRPRASHGAHAPTTSQSMSQSYSHHSIYPSNSNSIDRNHSHRDHRSSHAHAPPPLNTSSASHYPSGAQDTEPSGSRRGHRSSRTAVPTSTLQYTSRTQDVPSISRHRYHSSSQVQVSPTRYTSSQAVPTTSYHEQSSNLMPSESYTNSGNGYPNPTASQGVNHPQSQYPQAQSQSQTGHRSRTRRTSIDGFGANLHHSRPRLDDDACSDSDIEAPEPRNHRPHRAHPAQGASYGQPSFSQGYVGSVPPPGFQIVGGQAHTGWLRQMPVSDYSNSASQYPPSQYTVQQGWPGTSAPPGYPPYGGL